MNIISLLNDFNIPYQEEGKNISGGWIGLSCPFCNDTSTHLGYNLEDNYFSCWRCGGHPLALTVSKLLGVSVDQAKHLIRQYGITLPDKKKPEIKKEEVKILQYPSGMTEIQKSHRQYLIRRKFDPDYIVREWNIKGIGPYGKLDNIDYRYRIILPVIWNKKEVSFTSRDITDKHNLRYITCPGGREIINHKHILYGKQESWKETGICVEGPTDVWRLGPLSFATFGIKFTMEQVRVMSQNFKRIVVLFDNETQAQAQASDLVAELKFRGTEAFIVTVDDDPGNMKQEDADYLVKQLIR